jgi:hypothetical protein
MEALLPFLAFGTIGALVVFGYISAQRTGKVLHEDNRPSSLSAYGDDHQKGSV